MLKNGPQGEDLAECESGYRSGTGEGSKRKSPKGLKVDLMAGRQVECKLVSKSLHHLLTLSSSLLSEQARAAAGQLLRWKRDAHQDGYLLLKSAFVLSGTDSVSAGSRGLASSPPDGRPQLRAGCVSQCLSSQEPASPFSALAPLWHRDGF